MFYLLDKKKGETSFRAIKTFARENNIKKVGHTGTLDPMATGLLLIATDDDTKLIEYVDKGFKTYKAHMTLGHNSDTYDAEGELEFVSNVTPSEERVVEVIKSFEKTYDQMPPAFSARKINGQRAYDLARKGIEVKLKATPVTIKNISNIEKVADNEYSFEVTVSRGTYIRSLIFDIGQILETGAYMNYLRRTKIGSLDESIANSCVDVFDLLTLNTLEIFEFVDLWNGKTMKVEREDGVFALIYNKEIIGIGEVSNNLLKSKKIFGNKLKKY